MTYRCVHHISHKVEKGKQFEAHNHDIDIQILMRENDFIRQDKFKTKELPVLVNILKSIVPDHSFDVTHSKISHDTKECPAGDIHSDLASLGAIKYSKADQLKEIYEPWADKDLDV